MSDSEIRGSVSQWIEDAKRADRDAVHRLWERYFHQLVHVGRKHIAARLHVAADEEDAALSAFASFCDAAEAGRLSALEDRDALWRLLATLTRQKIIDQKRQEGRKKRGAGKLRGESVFLVDAEHAEQGFAQVMQEDPTPAEAALMAEEVQRLLNVLDDDLRAVALAKFEGHTNREIAEQQGRSLSSIERCLRLIRKKWQRELDEADG